MFWAEAENRGLTSLFSDACIIHFGLVLPLISTLESRTLQLV